MTGQGRIPPRTIHDTVTRSKVNSRLACVLTASLQPRNSHLHNAESTLFRKAVSLVVVSRVLRRTAHILHAKEHRVVLPGSWDAAVHRGLEEGMEENDP